MGRINTKRKSDDMKKKILVIIFLLNSLFLINISVSAESNIYKKIDLFGEVLEKINCRIHAF